MAEMPKHAPEGISPELMDELRSNIRCELLAGGTPEQIAEFFNVTPELVSKLFPGGREALLEEIRAGKSGHH